MEWLRETREEGDEAGTVSLPHQSRAGRAKVVASCCFRISIFFKFLGLLSVRIVAFRRHGLFFEMDRMGWRG
jgi:hypothetical protein